MVKAAISAVRQRVERSGANPLYATILISLMGNRRLKHEARTALVAQGESAIKPLVLFMRSPDEQIWVRRAVPKTIALIGAQSGADALLDNLGDGDAMVLSKIVEALVYMRTQGSRHHFQTPDDHPTPEPRGRRYVRLLADLWAVSSLHEARLDGPLAVWKTDGRVPTLPQQLLAQRMARSVNNIFGLLELINNPEDVRSP